MEIEFDPAKDALTQSRRGLSLADVARMDWASFRAKVDERRDYGEVRYRGFGYIDGRLHMVAFTFRGEKMRVISLRKAKPKEVRDYEQA